MTVWPASFFFGWLPEYVEATAVPFRFPQPARANQSGLCLKHHPTPSHNLLRHGDPVHWCLSGILVRRTAIRPVHDRQLTDALTGLRHVDPAHRYLSAIPAWRMGSSDRSSARRHCPQAPQWHPRVAKRSSDRSLAQPPCPQVLQRHPSVANGQPAGP